MSILKNMSKKKLEQIQELMKETVPLIEKSLNSSLVTFISHCESRFK